MARRQRLSSQRRWQLAGAGTVFIVAVLLGAAFVTAQNPPVETVPTFSAPPLANQQPKKVAIIGDSYTEGTAQGGAGDKSWQQLSLQQLRINGLDIDSSVSGEGGAGYSARGYRGSNFVEEARRVVTRDDDVVVIFGGFNDVLTNPVAETSAVAATLDFVRATAPRATIIVVGPVSPVPDAPPELIALRDAIRSAADRAGATFVDPIDDKWFDGFPGMIGADTIHPTDEGHAYISAKLLPVLRQALQPAAAP